MWDDLANWASIMGLLPAVWSEQSQSWLFLLVLLPVIPVSRWAWRRWTQQGVRVETTITRGPTSRELGFTEDAIKITVMNEGDHKIKIRDVRLMFYGEYGVSVAAEGPPGRCHSRLPMDVDTGAEETGTYLQINSPTCSAACTAHHQRPYQHHEMSSFMQGALVARARSTGVVASGSLWAIERMYSDKRHSVIFQQCPGDAGGRIRHFVTSLDVTGPSTVRPIKNLTRNSSFALKWLGTPAPNQI